MISRSGVKCLTNYIPVFNIIYKAYNCSNTFDIIVTYDYRRKKYNFVIQEIQKKKTDRLEMVPHRGFVHPWLSEPVWVPENTWQSKADPNRLRIEEENEEMSDRHRDKVSFGHEVILQRNNLF